MTDNQQPVSQGEFSLLKDMVAAQGTRIEAIDAGGTRGVGAIQAQLTDLVKDVTEMKAETTAWQNSHEVQHQNEARDRVTGRRWLIGIGIAGITALGGMYGFLEVILQHVHH